MHSALQLYSIQEQTAQAFLPTLEKVAEMGYESVQFAGFYNAKASEVKKVLDAKLLKVAGSHTGINDLQGEKYQATIEYNKVIGNNLIICPYLDESYRNSKTAYLKTAELLNEIGEKCASDGMVFGYHNHNFEFESYGDKTGFDLLFENTDEKLVKIELDAYWVTYAGFNPLEIMRTYRDRIISLHVKDMIEDQGGRQSIEIGKGKLEIENMLKLAQQFGVDWAVVEQEHFNQPPMESAAENVGALKKILDSIEGESR